MRIIPYEKKYAEQIAVLLNTFLPFQIETSQTVDEAGGVRFLCVHENDVIGYIAGYPITNYNEDFPYFEEQLMNLKLLVTAGTTYYSSHFVVNPAYRQRGIGTKLVEAYMQAVRSVANAVVVVGWVQSDTNRWAAQRQFEQQDFTSVVYITRYFEPYNVYCPSCAGTCYCDAHIMMVKLS